MVQSKQALTYSGFFDVVGDDGGILVNEFVEYIEAGRDMTGL
jgi:hypothetical protein